MKRTISIVLSLCAVILFLWVSRPRPVAADALPITTVTFNEQIVRILDDHCVACHSANGLSFPMETYEQTFVQGRAMRLSVLARHMPPWAAVQGYSDFVNSNRMTMRETQFVVSWVDGVGPRAAGSVFLNVVDPKAVSPPEVKAHFDSEHWELGKPDLLLSMPESAVAPQQTEQVKQTVIDPKLVSDRWLRGIEYKPGDRRVVHAVFFRIKETGQWIGSWTPWYGFFSLPHGLSYRLPAGSHIVAEIHYFGLSEPVAARGSIALYFASGPSSRAASDLALTPKCEPAEADVPAERCTAAEKLTADSHVLALWPGIRPGAQSIEVSARTPDGLKQVILLARDIPANWPTPYILKTPVALAKDTELSVTEYYANRGVPSAADIALIVSGYQGSALPSSELKVQQVKAPPAPVQRFKLAGTVRSVDRGSRSLVVQHGDIPGFMPAMTMTYFVDENEDLTKVSASDQIQADVVVSGGNTHLENITVVSRSK